MKSKWQDPVVEEVRKRGQAYTARFNHDVHAIAEDLRLYQRTHPGHYVTKEGLKQQEKNRA